jgi:hypothetical protein
VTAAAATAGAGWRATRVPAAARGTRHPISDRWSDRAATSCRPADVDGAHRLPAILVGGKQIFATHHVEGRLGLTMVLRDGSNGAPYLAYVNRSQIDMLKGFFGAFVPGVLEDRVELQAPLIVRGLRARLGERQSVRRAPRSVRERAPWNPLMGEASNTLSRWRGHDRPGRQLPNGTSHSCRRSRVHCDWPTGIRAGTARLSTCEIIVSAVAFIGSHRPLRRCGAPRNSQAIGNPPGEPAAGACVPCNHWRRHRSRTRKDPVTSRGLYASDADSSETEV